MPASSDSVERGGKIFTGELGIGVKDLLVCVAAGYQAENVRDHDPSPPDAGLSAADMGIDADSFVAHGGLSRCRALFERCDESMITSSRGPVKGCCGVLQHECRLIASSDDNERPVSAGTCFPRF